MGPIAQSVEQRTFNPWVDGSSPSGPTHIGSDVWIGYGVTILSGVSIGHGAVIGAGSVISKDVLPFSIVAGNPAKLVRLRFTPSQIEQLLKEAWWERAIEKIDAHIPLLMRAPQEQILERKRPD